MKYVNNLQENGLAMQYTIDQFQIKNIDIDAVGDCILLQSICVSQYLWENKIRGEFIEFIEQLTEVSDIRIESRFN